MDKKEYTMPKINDVMDYNVSTILGDDPVDISVQKETVPEIINHFSYSVAQKHCKPFVILSDEAYDSDADQSTRSRVSNYYYQLSKLVQNFNDSVYQNYICYHVHKCISDSLQELQCKVQELLKDAEIPYDKNQLYELLRDFPHRAYIILSTNVPIAKLNVIENMASYYVSNMNITKDEKCAKSGLELISNFLLPYINSSIEITLFELYNITMNFIRSSYLKYSIEKCKGPLSVDNYRSIELSLTRVFADINKHLMYSYNIFMTTCFFGRTYRSPYDKY